MPNLMDMKPAEISEALRTQVIAEQNDLFRNTLRSGVAVIQAAQKGITGRILVTQGVGGSGEAFQHEALQAVAAFDTFTEDNDPHGDHTFGALTIQGEKLFWKIDLYDTEFQYGSEEPWNPAVTRRVLTIMLAQEY